MSTPTEKGRCLAMWTINGKPVTRVIGKMMLTSTNPAPVNWRSLLIATIKSPLQETSRNPLPARPQQTAIATLNQPSERATARTCVNALVPLSTGNRREQTEECGADYCAVLRWKSPLINPSEPGHKLGAGSGSLRYISALKAGNVIVLPAHLLTV